MCSSPAVPRAVSVSAATWRGHLRRRIGPRIVRGRHRHRPRRTRRLRSRGSYGVNLFGYDFYKECIDAGIDRVRHLGPVLGSYHPRRRGQRRRLKRSPASTKSRSTCPAPKPSCRRCGWRASTRGARTSCASAAPTTAGGTTCSRGLAIRRRRDDLHAARHVDATLRVLDTRSDIACVLVNPLQALHPNAGAPG